MANKDLLFKCPFGNLTVYNFKIEKLDLIDCFYCRFSSEEHVEKLQNKVGLFSVNNLREVCNCPPVMTWDLYNKLFEKYRLKEGQSPYTTDHFNKTGFQNFVNKRLGIDKNFS